MVDVTDSAQLDAPGPVASPRPDPGVCHPSTGEQPAELREGEATIDAWRAWFRDSGAADLWDGVDDIEAALGRYDEDEE